MAWAMRYTGFVCRAICQLLAGQTVSLKEIEKAREKLVLD